jgi:phosphatidylglycerophosphatase C
MNTIDVPSALAVIERAPPDALVAFDCDGTLWSGDVGEDWFIALIEREGLTPMASSAMRAEAEAHQINVEAARSDRALAEALALAMHAGRYDEQRLYELMAWAAAGRTSSEVDAMLRRLLDRSALEARVHPETMTILRACMRRGRALVAVSASPRAVIERALALLGIEATAVCAATPASDGELLLPSLVGPMPYGHGKVLALRAAVGDREVAAALGDSAFDFELLSLARLALAVRPKPALRARAGSLPTLLELEPHTRIGDE